MVFSDQHVMKGRTSTSIDLVCAKEENEELLDQALKDLLFCELEQKKANIHLACAKLNKYANTRSQRNLIHPKYFHMCNDQSILRTKCFDVLYPSSMVVLEQGERYIIIGMSHPINIVSIHQFDKQSNDLIEIGQIYINCDGTFGNIVKLGDNNLAVSGTCFNTCIWSSNWRTQQIIGIIDQDDYVTLNCLIPIDDDYVLIGTHYSISMWEIGGKKLFEYKCHDIVAVEVLTDNRILVLTYSDIIILDIENQSEEVMSSHDEIGFQYLTLCLLTDSIIACGVAEGIIEIRDQCGKNLRREICVINEYDVIIQKIVRFTEGKLICLMDCIKIIDYEQGIILISLKSDCNWSNDLVFLDDYRFLACGDKDKVTLWQIPHQMIITTRPYYLSLIECYKRSYFIDVIIVCQNF